MSLVTFLPNKVSIEVSNGTTILAAARRAGVTIEAPCNGAGHCGKCLVRLPIDDLAHVYVYVESQTDDHIEGSVMACHTEVFGDITVTVPPRVEKGLRIMNDGATRGTELQPYIAKVYDQVNDTTMIRAGDKRLATEPGDRTGSNVGLVVDIGTTTLVAALVDLVSGETVGSASSLNPQSLHAQDVLSRIRFASAPGGLIQMQREIITELNRLLDELTRQYNLDRNEIYEAVVSGNTCMLHLLVGADPAPLGRLPFNYSVHGDSHVTAGELGLNIASEGLVYLPPVISAYVGADISAGILSSDLANLPGITLFIDIGTNGELVLATEGRLAASATAAGPAFEGMNISFGMRAAQGAIERATISAEGELQLGVIGGGEPTGICGSGLMDLVSELVRVGAVGASGRLAIPKQGSFPQSLAERIIKIDGGSAFHLQGHVVLSQKDIRQVQLAKGAIRAGIEMMLQHAGVTPDELDRVLIAGSFGFHLREESLITLGLLPPSVAGKVSFIGNTSRSGAELLIKNHTLRESLKDQTAAAEVVDLAGTPQFERVFMAMMGF